MSSAKENEFTFYVVDLMQAIGPVVAKNMFGGHGIFLDGLMFGLVADSVLYLKADKVTESDFSTKGLERFNYFKKGKEYKMSYYQAPEETLDDGDEMIIWATKAFHAAERAALKKLIK